MSTGRRSARSARPGQRTFYLQARQDDQLITLKLEKQQVAAIAQFLGEILSDLPVPDPLPDDDALALAEPVLAEWAVGGLQLAYDSEADRIVILAEEIGAEDDDETTTPRAQSSGRRAGRAEPATVRRPRRGTAEPDPDPGGGHRPPRLGPGQRRAAHLRPVRPPHRSRRSLVPADQRPPAARSP